MSTREETYRCDRCGYTNSIKGNFRRHLERKHKCPATHSDVEPFVLLAKYFPKKHPKKSDTGRFACPHCDRTYKHSFTLTRHLKTCKSAPTNNVQTSAQSQQIEELKLMVERLTERLDSMKEELQRRNEEVSRKDKQISELVLRTGTNINIQQNTTHVNILGFRKLPPN